MESGDTEKCVRKFGSRVWVVPKSAHCPRVVMYAPRTFTRFESIQFLIVDSLTGDVLEEHYHPTPICSCTTGRSFVMMGDMKGHVYSLDLRMVCSFEDNQLNI